MKSLLPLLASLALTGSLSAAGLAVTLNPTDSVAVSDLTTTTALGTVTPGGVASTYPVRSRADTGQDALQIVSYLQFDLSGFDPAVLVDPRFKAEFLIDYPRKLNTTANALEIQVGRNTGGPWDSLGSNFPLHDWAFVDETSTVGAADGVIVVGNVAASTPPINGITTDVTPIVTGWLDATNANDGFALFYTSNSFQGAAFENARLVLTIPEPSRGLLLGSALAFGLLRRRRA